MPRPTALAVCCVGLLTACTMTHAAGRASRTAGGRVRLDSRVAHLPTSPSSPYTLPALLRLPRRHAATDVTAIVSFYSRVDTVTRMLHALASQTLPPRQIWVEVSGSPVHDDIVRKVHAFNNTMLALRTPSIELHLFSSDRRMGYHGRFRHAMQAPTSRVAIFDDDCIPGARFLKQAMHVANTGRFPGVLGVKGHLAHPIAPGHTLQWYGPLSRTSVLTEVDVVGGAWVMDTATVKALYRSQPFTWATGEDIQLCAAVRLVQRQACYVLPADYDDPDTMGVSSDYMRLSDVGDTTDRAVPLSLRHRQERAVFYRGDARPSWAAFFRGHAKRRVLVVGTRRENIGDSVQALTSGGRVVVIATSLLGEPPHQPQPDPMPSTPAIHFDLALDSDYGRDAAPAYLVAEAWLRLTALVSMTRPSAIVVVHGGGINLRALPFDGVDCVVQLGERSGVDRMCRNTACVVREVGKCVR